MNAFEMLKKMHASESPLYHEERAALAAAIDLVESLQIDTSAGNTGDDNSASYMVMGNVNAGTLRALGFHAPEAETAAPSIVPTAGGFTVSRKPCVVCGEPPFGAEYCCGHSQKTPGRTE